MKAFKARARDKFVDAIKMHSDLSADRLRAMVDHLNVNVFEKGAILIHQGHIPTQCFFLIHGCARQYAIDADGKEITSQFYTESHSITIFAKDSRSESEFSVACLEDCVMIVGDLATESDERARFPEFEQIIIKMIQIEAGRLQQRLDLLLRLSPEARVKNILTHRSALMTRVPQHQLASYLGMTPESLSRIKSRIGYSPIT